MFTFFFFHILMCYFVFSISLFSHLLYKAASGHHITTNEGISSVPKKTIIKICIFLRFQKKIYHYRAFNGFSLMTLNVHFFTFRFVSFVKGSYLIFTSFFNADNLTFTICFLDRMGGSLLFNMIFG